MSCCTAVTTYQTVMMPFQIPQIPMAVHNTEQMPRVMTIILLIPVLLNTHILTALDSIPSTMPKIRNIKLFEAFMPTVG